MQLFLIHTFQSLIYILLTFFVLGKSDLYAQEKPKEIIRNELSKTTDDSTKVILLTQYANTLIYIKPDSAIYFATIADSISRKSKFEIGHAISLNALGNANWAKGNLKDGLSYFIQSKEVAKEQKDDYLVAKNTGSMGLIYRAAGNHQAALSYYRESLALFVALNYNERIAVSYNNIGKCFLEMGLYDSANYYFDKAYPIAKQYRPSMLPILSFNQSDAFLRQNNTIEAERYLTRSIEASLYYQDERMIIRGKQMLAEIKISQDSIDLAESLSKDAASKAKPSNVKELIFICYETLSNVYAKKKNYDSAYHYLYLYNCYKDSIQNADIQEKISFFDYEQQQKEILLLTKEKEIEARMLAKQKLSIYMLSGLLLIIVILAFILLQSRHQKSKDNKLLQLKNEEINFQKEELSAQAEKLQKHNQLKDKLFSIISHDLRSPLNTLYGSLTLVQNGLIDNDAFKAFLPELIKNVSNSNTLLDNLLHWAKSQLEGTEINPEIVNLKRITDQKTELLLHQARQKNVSLYNEISEDINVYADEIMIQIVLQNLLSNAIKYCNPGDQIRLFTQSQDPFIILCIQDTGMGIDDDNLKKLFNETSFTTRGTANEKGTGLGLVLCKEFIEKNGGRIWVESVVGQGSSFYISLLFYQQDSNTLTKSILH